MTEPLFNRDTFLEAFEKGALTQYHAAARDLATTLKRIANQSIRIDASPDELRAWDALLRQVAEGMEKHGQRDAKPINRRLFSGEATRKDVFDIFDYDPATGFANPNSPAIEFLEYGDVVRAQVCCGRQYQGPPNRVHGGTIMAIFDGLLSRVNQVKGDNGVTGTLTVRFVGSTPVNEMLMLSGWVDRIEGRKAFLKAEMHCNGELTASAEGVWIATRAREPKSGSIDRGGSD